MKGSGPLVASMLAASTVALTSSSSPQANSSPVKKGGSKSCTASSEKEKFAPRFDGLRFIETLVTAHR
ncbi:hypothetical protein SLA2020_371210 [Shorea laevis]